MWLVFVDVSKSLGVGDDVRALQLLLGNDKRLHFASGSLLGAFAWRVVNRRSTLTRQTAVLLSFTLASTVALVNEGSQWFIATRDFSFADLLAGLLGIASVQLLLALLLVLLRLAAAPFNKAINQ